MHCVTIGNSIENAQIIRLQNQVRASIFTSLKIVMHILFAIKGVFPKDLEPILSCRAIDSFLHSNLNLAFTQHKSLFSEWIMRSLPTKGSSSGYIFVPNSSIRNLNSYTQLNNRNTIHYVLITIENKKH